MYLQVCVAMAPYRNVIYALTSKAQPSARAGPDDHEHRDEVEMGCSI